MEKLKQFCYVVYLACHYFFSQQMIRFYNAYVQCGILYEILLYGSTQQSFFTAILKAQKRLIRAIHFKRPRELVHTLMIESTHATVFEIYLSNLIKEVYTFLKKALPVKSLNLSELTSSQNTPSSQKSLLHSKKRSSKTGKISLGVRFVVAYSFLQKDGLVPRNLKTSTNQGFKSFIQKFEIFFIRDNLTVHRLLL